MFFLLLLFNYSFESKRGWVGGEVSHLMVTPQIPATIRNQESVQICCVVSEMSVLPPLDLHNWKLESGAELELEPWCSHMGCRCPKQCPNWCAKNVYPGNSSLSVILSTASETVYHLCSLFSDANNNSTGDSDCGHLG